MSNQFLYVFVTCQDRFSKVYSKIREMMHLLDCDDWLIVKGGFEKDELLLDQNILQLKCNDFYEGLPEKVFCMLRTFCSDDRLRLYTHVCKLDDDMQILRLLPSDKLGQVDYCGKVQFGEGSRTWHIGKCSDGSVFQSQEYTGSFVPWCRGGYGYVLTRRAAEVVADAGTGFDPVREIYEDVFVGKALRAAKIEPRNWPNLSKFLKSPHDASDQV